MLAASAEKWDFLATVAAQEEVAQPAQRWAADSKLRSNPSLKS